MALVEDNKWFFDRNSSQLHNYITNHARIHRKLSKNTVNNQMNVSFFPKKDIEQNCYGIPIISWLIKLYY